MNKPYNPIAGSIAFKVIEYFTTNPDEVLTIDDLEAKFDKPKGQFHSFLGPAVHAGILKRESNDEFELEYSLGTGVASIKPNAGRNPTVKAKPYDAAAPFGTQLRTPKPSREKVDVPPIDPSTIAIVNDVPLPTVAPKGPQSDWPKWEELFKKMGVGESFALNMDQQKRVKSKITRAHKAKLGKWVSRKIDAEKFGVWRVE